MKKGPAGRVLFTTEGSVLKEYEEMHRPPLPGFKYPLNLFLNLSSSSRWANSPIVAQLKGTAGWREQEIQCGEHISRRW